MKISSTMNITLLIIFVYSNSWSFVLVFTDMYLFLQMKSEKLGTFTGSVIDYLRKDLTVKQIRRFLPSVLNKIITMISLWNRCMQIAICKRFRTVSFPRSNRCLPDEYLDLILTETINKVILCAGFERVIK